MNQGKVKHQRAASAAITVLSILGPLCCLGMFATGLFIIVNAAIRIFSYIPTHVLAGDRPEDYFRAVTFAVSGPIVLLLSVRWSKAFRARSRSVHACPEEMPLRDRDSTNSPAQPATSVANRRPPLFRMFLCLACGLFLVVFGGHEPASTSEYAEYGPGLPFLWTLVGLAMMTYSSSRLVPILKTLRDKADRPDLNM